MQFQIHQASRQGFRHSNQDRVGYVYTNDCLLMIVCDGMGGHLKGEIASGFIVEFVAKAFRQSAVPKIKDPSRFLQSSIIAAHQRLIAYAVEKGLPDTPRTTCVVAIVQDGRAWWANVGDSRLYLIRDSFILERTLDHSHVQSLIDAGVISEDQASVHPERHKIYNCLGQASTPRIDIRKAAYLKQGDILLLGTDGLWGPLDPEFLAQTMTNCSLPLGTDIAMNLAENLAGKDCDNLSCVIMKWVSREGRPVDQAPEEEDPSHRSISDTDLDISMKMIGMSSGARKAAQLRNEMQRRFMR